MKPLTHSRWLRIGVLVEDGGQRPPMPLPVRTGEGALAGGAATWGYDVLAHSRPALGDSYREPDGACDRDHLRHGRPSLPGRCARPLSLFVRYQPRLVAGTLH